MTLPHTGPMADKDWSSLVPAIEQGNCILMIGRDAVMGTFNGDRLPLSVGLARFVKDKLGPKYAELDAHTDILEAEGRSATEDEDVFVTLALDEGSRLNGQVNTLTVDRDALAARVAEVESVDEARKIAAPTQRRMRTTRLTSHLSAA